MITDANDLKELLDTPSHNTDKESRIAHISSKLKPGNHREGHVTVAVFDVHITEKDGTDLGTFPLEIAYPSSQDVVDTVLYHKEGDTIFVCTDTNMRPVLSARKALGDPEQQVDSLAEGAYTIFDIGSGDISFEDAVKRALKNKLNFESNDIKMNIGSSYFPAIGASSEVALSCYIDLTGKSKPKEGFSYGEKFTAEKKVEFMPLQKVVDNFFAHRPGDMRLLLHVLELARKSNIKLHIPHVQGITHDIFSPKDIPAGVYVVEGDQAEEVLQKLDETNNYTIELKETSKQPSFIKAYTTTTSHEFKDDTQESYDAQMVVRNGVDTIDTIPYFRSEGKLYIIGKLGIRPALLARDYLPHYISLSPSLSNVESIAGSKLSFDTDILQQNKKILTSKLGEYEDISTIHAGSYFPSAGNNPEKTELVYTHIDPASLKLSGWEEFDCIPSPVIALELDTIFDLYEKNIIKDPRLVLAADLLRQQYDYSHNEVDKPITTISKEDKERFYEALNRPLQIDYFYKFSAEKLNDPSIYELHTIFKKKSAWYRKVMSYVEEELGGFFATQEWLLSETDKHFFDAAVPSFAVPSAELAAKYQNYAAHDDGHYVQGTIIPTPEMSKETYVRLMSKTEAHAVFDSDYRYPKEIGITDFEKTIGGNKSLARSFDNLGYDDPKEVLEAVISLEVDGVIPQRILTHPNYQNERENIIYRVMRFHFYDKHHAEAQYDQRMKNQILAKVVLRFGNCYDNEEDFEERMSTYEHILGSYGEGVNNIRAYVMRVVTRDITIPALKIGLVLQMLHDNGIEESSTETQQCNLRLDELAFYKKQIQKIHADITGIEYNEKNIKAVRDADILSKKISMLTERFEEYYMKLDTLTLDQKEKLKNNRMPFFSGFAEMPENTIQMLEELERSQMGK